MTSATGSSQLLAFIKFLRGKDVPVSPADTLDAVHAAGLLGYEDRTTLRDGLAAVLAKSTFEESAYREAFDLFSRRNTPKLKHRMQQQTAKNHRNPPKILSKTAARPPMTQHQA